MDKEVAVFGERIVSLDKTDLVYLGLVEDFLNMSEDSFDEMRLSIYTNFGAVWCRGVERQMSKLCFISKIRDMRKKNG